jgi:hypothetical protein
MSDTGSERHHIESVVVVSQEVENDQLLVNRCSKLPRAGEKLLHVFLHRAETDQHLHLSCHITQELEVVVPLSIRPALSPL